MSIKALFHIPQPKLGAGFGLFLVGVDGGDIHLDLRLGARRTDDKVGTVFIQIVIKHVGFGQCDARLFAGLSSVFSEDS